MNLVRMTCALALLLGAVALAGCRGGSAPAPAGEQASAPATAASPTPGPLPESGYRAQLTLPDAPTRMRAGQKQTLNVKVKNTSDVKWVMPHDVEGNKYVVAVMDSWLDRDGVLVTNMDGRYGIQEEVPPGAEVELPLLVTAPGKPGDYILELDMLQEQVGFFKDHGSQPLRVNIKVE